MDKNSTLTQEPISNCCLKPLVLPLIQRLFFFLLEISNFGDLFMENLPLLQRKINYNLIPKFFTKHWEEFFGPTQTLFLGLISSFLFYLYKAFFRLSFR